MQNISLRRASFFALAALALAACNDPDDETDLLRLSDAIADPVNIELDGLLGSAAIPLKSALEPADAKQMSALIGKQIRLVVRGDESGVTCDLVEGKRVEGTPKAPGEYSVTAPSGASAVVRFYNEFQKHALSPDGVYSALVEVVTNPYFAVEQFGRKVKVVEK